MKAIALSLFLSAFFLIGSHEGAMGKGKAGTPASAPDAILNLVRHCDEEFNRGKHDSALACYQDAYRLAESSGQEDWRCEILNNMAAVFMATQDLERFPNYFLGARRCRESRDDIRLRAGQASSPENLLANGGFEEGIAYPWGTGHYETAAGKTRFGSWWNSMNARAFMKIDSNERHSGERSVRVTNYSPAEPHVFLTTSQRIPGLRPNTVYRVSLYAKARDLARGAVSFAVDAAWGKRILSLPPGTYDWTRFSETINIGHNDYMDFRLIHQNTGTVWLDDIFITRTEEDEGLQAMLQRAESLLDRAQFREALEVCREIERAHSDNQGALIRARHIAGRIHLSLGQYADALKDLTWVAGTGFRHAPIDLGDLHYQLGDFDRANALYEDALNRFKGDQGTVSIVHDRIAASFLAQGKLEPALQAQTASLRVLRHIGDRHGEARALSTLGMILTRKGEHVAALENFSAASRLARQLDDSPLLAQILCNAGEAALRAGQRDEAAAHAGEAIAISRSTHDPRALIQSLYLQGRLFRLSGDTVRALQDLREAVGLLDGLYSGLGVTPRETRETFLGQFTGLYREYVDLLLEMHGSAPGSGYDEEAFRMAETARARLFAEMVSEVRAAQVFSDNAADPAFRQMLDREREACLRVQAARHQREIHLRASGRAPDPQVLSALEQAIVIAEEACRSAQEEMARAFPRYADLRSPRPIGFREVQALLRPDEAVLCYFVTDSRTGVWALDAKQTRLAVLPLGRSAMLQETRALTRGLPAIAQAIGGDQMGKSPASDPKARLREAFAAFVPDEAHRLYLRLVKPVEKVLASKKWVLIAPDDVLYQLPFEALLTRAHDPAEPRHVDLIGAGLEHAPFWVQTQTLSYLPSVSVLRSLRTLRKPRTQGQYPLVAFADPVFDEEPLRTPTLGRSRGALLDHLRNAGALAQGRLARLPETAEEARRAASALGGSSADLYLREQATERNVKTLPLRDFRTVLFATHGLMAGEFRPGVQPCLALSFVGDPGNDGLLEMSEILALDFNADLVVLSACNTGRSAVDGDRGEGFAGLTRSFMYAGAEALTVTLWSVESSTALDLMDRYYHALRKASRALALAEAKRAMIARAARVPAEAGLEVSTAHPFFWAPFILVGEAR